MNDDYIYYGGDGFDEYRGFDQDLRDAYADGYVDALDAVSSAVEHEEKCQSRLLAYPMRECNCYRHDVVTAIARLREGEK